MYLRLNIIVIRIVFYILYIMIILNYYFMVYIFFIFWLSGHRWPSIPFLTLASTLLYPRIFWTNGKSFHLVLGLPNGLLPITDFVSLLIFSVRSCFSKHVPPIVVFAFLLYAYYICYGMKFLAQHFPLFPFSIDTILNRSECF